MKKNSHFRTTLFFCTLLVFSSIFIAFGLWPSNASWRDDIRIINKTRAVESVRAEKHKGHLRFSFVNGYDKIITAYAIATSKTSRYSEDFIYSDFDPAISPGAYFERTIPDSSESDAITILAVIFDDKTSDGDPKIIQEIDHNRLGDAIQFTRAISVLEDFLRLPDSRLRFAFHNELQRDMMNALSAPEADTVTALKELKPSMFSSDFDSGSQLPDRIAAGLNQRREGIQYELQEIANLRSVQSEVGLRHRIRHMVERYKKFISRI